MASQPRPTAPRKARAPARSPATAPAHAAAHDSPRRSARERLLAAAEELFYGEGIHTVGIDRVIERAGVAKASLYDTFGSKEELIRSYLAARHEARRARIEKRIAGIKGAREKVLGIFDSLAEATRDPGFRGCAFVRASAESRPGSRVEEVVGESREWLRGLFASLAREAGAAHPDRVARQLMLIYDGVLVATQLERDPAAGTAARAVAAQVLDAAIPARR